MKMIETLEYEENGNVYVQNTYENGTVEKYLKPPEIMPDPPYIPTDEEEAQAQILLNQADIMAKQEEQDEVLAALLLQGLEV